MESKFEKAFTVTMLGSLTDFTPELKQARKQTPYTKGATVSDYPKGETLSIASFLIKSNAPIRTIKTDAKNPYPFQSENNAVVNGPNMEASNVGEKIALGLAVILKAVARGKTLINLIAHSRGTIESILIAHELEVVQIIIASCTNFEEVLKQLEEQQSIRYKNKPTNNTPDIIETLKFQINLIPKEEQEQWFNNLKTYLPETSINLFGTDPVPGDFFPITWYDERYFLLPEIIKNIELIYYANEHSSRGFTPVFPEVLSKEKQHFVCYSMPGHHGTGTSGNNGSQQGIIVSPDNYKTTQVQKIILYKILHFLNKHGVEFNDGTQIFHDYTALGRKYLGIGIEIKSIHVATLDFPTILRTLYSAIAKNQMGYEAYNSTYYSYMGFTKHRNIMQKGRTYNLFDNLFPIYSGYVNEEHALLVQAHFLKMFHLDNNRENLAEMLTRASSVLEEQFKKIVNKKTSALDSEVDRKNVLETFGIVIKQMCQQYLTDDWRPLEKQQEKENLYQTIAKISAQFKELLTSDNLIIRQFFSELHELTVTGLNQTLLLRAKDLERGINCLQESVDNRLTRFFDSLLIQLKHSPSTSTSILDGIKNSEEYKILPNHPVSIKITHIFNKLTKNGLEKYSVEQLVMSYEEQFSTSLEDFANLHQQIHLFSHDLFVLRDIIANEKIEVDEMFLLKQSNNLIVTAAERFYKERPDELPSIDEPNEFIKLAESYAIKHFNVIDRQKEKNSTNTESSSLFSSTFSFFWRPVSQMIYGSPVTNKEVISNGEPSISTSSIS